MLQKFSGSDRSSGELGDLSPRRKVNLRRQEACAVGSSDESDSRRTPERTQSLRVKKLPSPDERKPVQRSESFKSDFMRKRCSPETILDTPVDEDTETMATPNPELAAILNKRHKVVTDQQIQGQKLEKEQIYSNKIEKEDQIHKLAEVDEVISDSQVASVLKARLNESDSSKSGEQNNIDNRFKPYQKTEDIITDTEVANILKVRKTETDSKIPEEIKTINKDYDQSSQQQIVTPKVVSDNKVNKSVHSSLAPAQKTEAKQDTVTPSVSEVSSSVSSLVTTAKTHPPEHKLSTDTDKSGERTKPVKTDVPAASAMPHVVSNIKSSELSEKESDKEISPLRSLRSSVSPCKDNVLSSNKQSTSSSKSSIVRRAESYGAKDTERPKGILKRTKSMKSSVIVDKELASILQRRKKEQDDDSDENVDDKPSDVASDIQETLR